jgi:hypothetical protein
LPGADDAGRAERARREDDVDDGEQVRVAAVARRELQHGRVLARHAEQLREAHASRRRRGQRAHARRAERQEAQRAARLVPRLRRERDGAGVRADDGGDGRDDEPARVGQHVRGEALDRRDEARHVDCDDLAQRAEHGVAGHGV